MATCVPFIGVPNIAETIKWYEGIGFKCTGTNHIWEPDCNLNWAELAYEDARFMLYPYPFDMSSEVKYAGLYFLMDSIDPIIARLKEKARIIEINEETFYGRKEVVIKDLNGLQVTFSTEPGKK